MNQETTRILNNLIDGVDPVSGKKLPTDLAKILKHKSVLAALQEVLNNSEDKKAKPATRYGAKWTEDESAQLTQLWKTHPDLSAIAVIMGRTPIAIGAKLVDLNVCERRDQVPGYEDHRLALKLLREEVH